MLKMFEQLRKKVEDKKIETFDDLQAQDKVLAKRLVELSQATPAHKLDGLNIGLFGITSSGKSTIINKCIGQNVAETGVGETTIAFKAYPGATGFFWDCPGRNDSVSYLRMEFIAFYKAMSRRLIIILATIREMSTICKLLDSLQLSYDIVVNKIDLIQSDEELRQFRRKIQTEVAEEQLKGVSKIYFISARYPDKSNDWNRLIANITKHR